MSDQAAIIAIAEAVKHELNGAPADTFRETFEAVRSYVPGYSLDELRTLRVTVVPKANTSEPLSRASYDDRFQIDIGIQQQVDPKDTARIDQLVRFVEQVFGYMKRRALTEAPEAKWRATANEPVYSQRHLMDNRTFTSVITLDYQVL